MHTLPMNHNAQFYLPLRYDNPPAGTVLDNMVTNKNDFFLVPMSVNLGTVTPTHYIVAESGSIEIGLIQKVAYALRLV